MTSNVVPLDALDTAAFPSAGEVEIPGALPPYVVVAQVVIQLVRRGREVRASGPLALDVFGLIVVRVARTGTEGRSVTDAPMGAVLP